MQISKRMYLNVNVKLWLKTSFVVLMCGIIFSDVTASEITGYASLEYRYFKQESALTSPGQHAPSVILSPEFYTKWDGGLQSLLFSPFLRLDREDAERTHADIRELQWLLVQDDWELRIGVGKVFWGVTESQNLVDVINQTDLVENTDGDDKLGQPMINISLFQDWGTVDLFVLPLFRERTFPGQNGRLRFPVLVDTDAARYESGAGRRHVDLAVRWTGSVANWDIGVSHFYGTNREPLFSFNDAETTLIPYYEIMHQSGLEVQYTVDAWLWKLEAIHRDTNSLVFSAMTGGLEYTFYSAFESDIDVGLIAEYLFNDRDDQLLSPFQDDILLGTRLTWNDVQSTELLVGVLQDLRSQEKSISIEASRRLGQRWTLSLEGRFFDSDDTSSLFYQLRQDDYIQLELARYF